MKTLSLSQPAAMAQVQLPGAAPAQEEQAEGPQITQEEAEAYQKIEAVQIQSMADIDRRIEVAEEFIAKFPNSTLLPFVYGINAESYQYKGDSVKAVFYYEEALKADPEDYNSMLMIALNIAQGTKEFDLNKEEKLTRATKLATDGLNLASAAEKPNEAVDQAQWDALKANDMARAHEALGMIAVVRKEYDKASTEFQSSLDTAADPQPAVYVRLGNALNEAGRPDEAITVLNKVIGIQGMPDVIKQVAETEKKRSEQIRANLANQSK